MITAKDARAIAEEGHAEHPTITTDPVWSDTWAFAAVDPDSKQAAFMHILCNSSTGKARHMLMGISDGKGWREDAYTDNYLSSELVDVELDGWQRYSIRHKARHPARRHLRSRAFRLQEAAHFQGFLSRPL